MTTNQRYQEWIIPCKDPHLCEVLSAYLWELGFDGLEEADGMLKACGLPENIAAGDVQQLLADYRLEATVQELLPQNWNAQWEASFEPVMVGTFCRIRAAFHPEESGYQHQICITPKMSFGTGHHATTRMMIGAMQEITFPEKAVLDFGAGTGVLAILAEQLGAARVLAIENDPGAVENAVENVAANQGTRVEVRIGSLETAGEETFDVVLANINRNILLQYASKLAVATRPGGILVISGILVDDMPLMQDALEVVGFRNERSWSEGSWACMRFKNGNISLASDAVSS